MPDYKQISQDISQQHQDKGMAFIPLFGEIINEILVNLSDDKTYVSFEGKKITPKKIRKFLWDHKKDRRFQRKRAILWSAYNDEEDKSYLGVGATASHKLQDKFKDRILWKSKPFLGDE